MFQTLPLLLLALLFAAMRTPAATGNVRLPWTSTKVTRATTVFFDFNCSWIQRSKAGNNIFQNFLTLHSVW
jgi:hypothetical protein